MIVPHYSETAAVAKSISLRDSGQLLASLSLLHVACDEDPGNSMAWHQLGIGYVHASNIGHARQCLLRAADISPDNVQIISHLANVFVLEKDMDAAIEQGKKLVTLNPGAAEVHLFLGNLYASRSRFDEALHCVRMSIEIGPEILAAHVLLAQIELARGRHAEALAAIRKALQIDPANAQVQQLLKQIEHVQR